MPHIENYLKAIITAKPNSSTQELDELQVKAHNHTLYVLFHIPVKCSFLRNFSIMHCVVISFSPTVQLVMLQKTQTFMKNLMTQSSACPVE